MNRKVFLLIISGFFTITLKAQVYFGPQGSLSSVNGKPGVGALFSAKADKLMFSANANFFWESNYHHLVAEDIVQYSLKTSNYFDEYSRKELFITSKFSYVFESPNKRVFVFPCIGVAALSSKEKYYDTYTIYKHNNYNYWAPISETKAEVLNENMFVGLLIGGGGQFNISKTWAIRSDVEYMKFKGKENVSLTFGLLVSLGDKSLVKN